MNEVRIEAPPELNQDTGALLYKSIRKQKPQKGRTLVLDLGGTSHLDTPGSAWLIETSGYLRRRHVQFRWEGEKDQVAEFLHFVQPAIEGAGEEKPRRTGLFDEFTDVAVGAAAELKQAFGLGVDAIYWTLLAPLEGRGFRWGLLMDEIHEMGVRAIRIVFLMNLLLGLIIAMLSAKQVESFGVQLWVADLIVIGFGRELAAIMTAVVVSARTGAAIAAELATMKVQEEIDALRGMGLNVVQFLVAPKLLALVIVLPCLWILGMLAGIAGGSIWGIVVLGFQPDIWFTQTLNATHFGDLFQGLLKTFFFAIAIALVGCHNGLRVEGGSRGVGLMTTRAVVMDIFVIINIDIVFATLFYYIL